MLLLGGDPGIGKSTLLIQVAAALAQAGHRVVYISGEEAVAQVRLRAERLGLATPPVELAAETSVEDIVATLSQGEPPRLVIIDSIQTMWTDTVEFAPGTVTQVRGSAQALIRFAKRSGAAVIWSAMSPRTARSPARAWSSNGRCGALVRGRRLAPVPHPARGQKPLRPDRRDRRVRDDRLGLARGRKPVRAVSVRARSRPPGTAVFAGIEGTRPLLVEIQALVGADLARHAAPRRGRLGPSRLSMVLAVLEAHCGVRLAGHDVYLNVAGGLRIHEPAADLAAAAALVSSLANAPLPADAVYFGEVSLSGAVRPVAQTAARLKEAQKLGFARAIVPEAARVGGRQRLRAVAPVGDGLAGPCGNGIAPAETRRIGAAARAAVANCISKYDSPPRRSAAILFAVISACAQSHFHQATRRGSAPTGASGRSCCRPPSARGFRQDGAGEAELLRFLEPRRGLRHRPNRAR